MLSLPTIRPLINKLWQTILCIKCNESHEPAHCRKTTREGDPQCCNCNMFHAANRKKCIYYLNYKDKISIFKKTPTPRTFNSDYSYLGFMQSISRKFYKLKPKKLP